jgi:hypothetical protein
MIEAALTQSLQTVDLPINRTNVARCLCDWFDATRKAPVDKLPERISAFKAELVRLANNFSIKVESDKLKVIVTGDSIATLGKIANGSLWFNGEPRIEDLIAGAAFQ